MLLRQLREFGRHLGSGHRVMWTLALTLSVMVAAPEALAQEAPAEPEPNLRVELDRVEIACHAEDGGFGWSLVAKRIEVDPDDGNLHIRHVTVRLGKVPVFWFPYLRYPTGPGGQSGLLPPHISTDSEHGVDVDLPIYIRPGPRAAYTITPRLWGRRGLGVETKTEWLWLPHQYSSLTALYLPSDQLEEADRWGLALRGARRRRNWQFDFEAVRLSDLRVVEDLSPNDHEYDPIDRTPLREYSVSFSGGGAGHQASFRIDAPRRQLYPEVAIAAQLNQPPTEYRRVPEVTWSYDRSPISEGIALRVFGDAALGRFTAVSPTGERRNGAITRFKASGGIGTTLSRGGQTVGLDVSAHTLRYTDNDRLHFSDSATDDDMEDSSISVNLRWDTLLVGRSGLWSLGGRIRTGSATANTDLPLIDTSDPLPLVDSIASASAPIGGDRLPTGLRSALWINHEPLSLSGNQWIWHVGYVGYNREAALGSATADGESRDLLIVGSEYRRGRWEIQAGASLDRLSTLVAASARTRFATDKQAILAGVVIRDLGYADKETHAMLGFDTRISRHFRLTGRMVHDAENSSLIDSEISISWENCCVSVGFRVRDRLRSDLLGGTERDNGVSLVVRVLNHERRTFRPHHDTFDDTFWALGR